MRVLILHNEKSGQGEAGFKTFLAALERGGVEYQVRSLEEGVKLEDLLADAPEFGAVVAAGGDGTVSGTAHALRD
ncbi:MAG: diacylglycerol kinase, partial [Meiothermus sp.]